MRAMIAWVARAGSRLAAGAALLLLLAGVPAGLAAMLGWPLPTSVPTSQTGWEHLLTAPIPDTAILRLLGIAAWLLWAMFAHAVWIEARAVWHGVRAPRSRRNPIRGLAALLVATIALGWVATAATAATPAAAATAPPSRAPAVATATLPAGIATLLPHTSHAAPTEAVARQAPTLPAGPAVLLINDCPHVYTVAKGDTLWHIADMCLGDPTRWDEIWQLNEGRFWPAVSGYKTLDNPDLIYPRWTLTLPADATAPPGAQPAEPATPPTTVTPATPAPGAATATPTPTATPTTSPAVTATASPTGSITASPDSDDGVVGPPTPAPSATASPSTSNGAAPTSTPSAAVSATSPPSADATPTAAPAVDEHGVGLDDESWLPWTVVGAAIAAMAVVWLQRRRRYIPRPMDGTAADDRPEPAAPPPTVRRLQHSWRVRPKVPATEPHTAELPAAAIVEPTVVVPPVPPMDPLPVGGLGLTGPGAEAAARGAMVAALAAGAPTDPDAHTTVIIPVDTMMTLLGADAVALGTWHRLRVTPDIETALTVLEERLLHAARLLDDYDVADIAALRASAPAEEPLPPMLLIADTPPAGTRVRARMVLGLGTGVEVSALLLGAWAHGPTAAVDTDGTCRRQPGDDGVVPARMPVLDTAAAVDLLHTLREAHTGEATAPATPEPTPTAVVVHNDEKADDAPDNGDDPRASMPANEERAPLAPDDGDEGGIDAVASDIEPSTSPLEPPTSSEPVGQAAATPSHHEPVRAQVKVLGPPRIVDQPLEELVRSTSIELMVYLAVHADGAHPDQIIEDMWIGVRPRLAASRLHTAVSNLRKLLAGSIADTVAEAGVFVVKQHGRYRLNPALVDVDRWRLRAAPTAARAAGGDATRLQALRDVCELYTGTLAADEAYEWIERHRQGVLSLAIDAHTALATAIGDIDPTQASQLLQAAMDHDPLNEDVAQQGIRACHRLGDPDAIRAVLRRLALALDEIGAEPSAETADLADQLRRDLIRRPR